MRKTEVHILGQKYSVKGDASEEHMQMLAHYVDKHIKEILSSAPSLTPTNAAILAAFNMADEIHKLKAEQDKIGRLLDDRTQKISALFE